MEGVGFSTCKTNSCNSTVCTESKEESREESREEEDVEEEVEEEVKEEFDKPTVPFVCAHPMATSSRTFMYTLSEVARLDANRVMYRPSRSLRWHMVRCNS